jgi:hypothetical protein
MGCDDEMLATLAQDPRIAGFEQQSTGRVRRNLSDAQIDQKPAAGGTLFGAEERQVLWIRFWKQGVASTGHFNAQTTYPENDA